MRRQLHALLDAGFGPLDFFSHDIRKWVGRGGEGGCRVGIRASGWAGGSTAGPADRIV